MIHRNAVSVEQQDSI